MFSNDEGSDYAGDYRDSDFYAREIGQSEEAKGFREPITEECWRLNPDGTLTLYGVDPLESDCLPISMRIAALETVTNRAEALAAIQSAADGSWITANRRLREELEGFSAFKAKEFEGFRSTEDDGATAE